MLKMMQAAPGLHRGSRSSCGTIPPLELDAFLLRGEGPAELLEVLRTQCPLQTYWCVTLEELEVQVLFRESPPVADP